jgi:hypothetical protein
MGKLTTPVMGTLAPMGASASEQPGKLLDYPAPLLPGSNYCYLRSRDYFHEFNDRQSGSGGPDRCAAKVMLLRLYTFSTAYFSAFFANDSTIKGNIQNKDIPLSFSDLQWSASRLEWIHGWIP